MWSDRNAKDTFCVAMVSLQINLEVGKKQYKFLLIANLRV